MHELAILRYKGAPDDEPNEEESWNRQGLTLNPWNEKRSDLNIPFVALNSTGISNHAFILEIFGTKLRCRMLSLY